MTMRPWGALVLLLAAGVLTSCAGSPEFLDNGAVQVAVYPEPQGVLAIAQPADVIDLGDGCVGVELPGYDESPMILAVPLGSTLDADGNISVVTPDILELDEPTFAVGDQIHMQAAHIYRKGEHVPDDVLIPDACPSVGVWLMLPYSTDLGG
ncbi:MAG: hypothetical protein ACTHNQ_18650 [Microbacterium sp.]|uniref:hypothetical protein n=1 Tax=Microbacterium sp. TaxID=51671 RepID=UPI0012DE6CD6